MARICGVCKLPPREGDIMLPIRITEDDLEAVGEIELGLYSACRECAEEHRARVAERLCVELQQVTNNGMC